MAAFNWIDQFFGFFEARIEFLRANCLETIEGIVLMTSYLDALAGYKYGGYSSQDRFCNFIVDYSGLADTWKKVSLRKLYDHLLDGNDCDLKAAAFLRAKYQVDDFFFMNLNHNPDVVSDEIMQGLTDNRVGSDVDRASKLVSRYEYASILWRDYRCNAVHEITKPRDEAFNLAEKIEPFYSSGMVPGNSGAYYRVVWFAIPPQFILRTLEGCLSNFRREWEDSSFDYRSMVVAKLRR